MSGPTPQSARWTGRTTAGFVLGVDLGGTKTALATTDLSGTRLDGVQMPTGADEGAARVIGRVLRAARNLIDQTVPRAGPLLAVGAVSPGIVLEDKVLLAPNNPGWDTLALADELRGGLGVDLVCVDTDAKAGALAEARWGELLGVANGIFLNLGTGISAAFVVDGRVLRGANGAAGEIGYQLLGVPGEGAFTTGRAPLEDHVSGRAIGERASEIVRQPRTAAEAFALSAVHLEISRLILDSLDALARHVANLAIAFDPERIVVGGGLMGSAPLVLPRLEAAMTRAVPFPPTVVAARFRVDAPLVGASVLALDAALGGEGAAVSDGAPPAARHVPAARGRDG